MKKRIIIAAVIIILLIVIGLGIFLKLKKKIVQYETAPLKKCTITQVVEASGTINPVNTINIGSQISGLITDIYVDYNSKIKKGQVLALIDTSLLDAQVANAQANINNAQANLEKIEAVAKNNKLTYDRYKNLYKRNFISKSELDAAQYTYESDLAQLRSARAQIAQAKSSYKTATTNLRYTKITSPVDGTVIAKKVNVGQTVAASFQTPELFTVAQDLTQMQIETSVSEADIGKVHEGQEAEYTLDGYPDEVFKGRVSQVRLSSTTVSNVVTYTVLVQVDNEDLKLKPGMSANVSIISDRKKDVLCAPNSALKFSPADNTEKFETHGIWIMEKKKPKRVDIKTGIGDDRRTEVISKDLKEGDIVITGAKSDETQKSSRGGRPPIRF